MRHLFSQPAQKRYNTNLYTEEGVRTKKEKIEAEDTRELSREVVGVGRKKKLIGNEKKARSE